MSRLDKKQRHKAKRNAKRQAARRMNSISPVKRLADAKGEIECWMSDSLEETGQAQAFVYKRAAGLTGVACFLIDRGVVGLKDAWTRTRIERAEFDSMMDGCADQGIDMSEASVEEVRDLVAGAIRWAHDNGMRLPKDWQKAAAFIGGVGDWATADVSDFAMEFAGHPNDLRQRLIAVPFEEYIQRKDIEFIFSADAPYLDQKTGRYSDWPDAMVDTDDDDFLDDESVPVEELNAIAEQFTAAAVGLAVETADWLKARNEIPSPELFEGWRSTMLAAMLANAAVPDIKNLALEDLGDELLDSMADRLEESRADEHDRAVDQIVQHLDEDRELIRKAVVKYGLKRE